MQTARWIFQISRPRFWFYLLGPVLLALAATYSYELNLFGKGAQSDGYSDWVSVIVVLLYFTLPANLIIYGVNDLFDYETDKNNDKKKSYETLLEPKNRKKFLTILGLVGGISTLILTLLLLNSYGYSLNGYAYGSFWSFEPNTKALWSLAGFLFFGIGYSTPPIRAKTKPFIDAFFNVLYIFPGILMYAQITQEFPPTLIIVSASLWVMAMHAFSAVPDIEADKKAKISTIATVLGRDVTIILCAALYILSAVYALGYIGGVSYLGIFTYSLMMLIAYRTKSHKELFTVYKVFPYINIVFGFVLFWTVYGVN